MSKHKEVETANHKLVKEIDDFLKGIDSAFVSQINSSDDDTHTIQGPFPSMIVVVGGAGPNGYYISVNADAVTMAMFAVRLNQAYPELQHLGAFCENIESPGVTMGDAAYALKEQHIVLQSMEIMRGRKLLEQTPELIVPEEKKLVLAR